MQLTLHLLSQERGKAQFVPHEVLAPKPPTEEPILVQPKLELTAQQWRDLGLPVKIQLNIRVVPA